MNEEKTNTNNEKNFEESIKLRRKEASKTGIILFGIIVITLLLCIILYLNHVESNYIIYIFTGGLFLIIIVAFLDHLKDEKFKNEYKNIILLDILKAKFDNVTLDIKSGIPIETVREPRMITTTNNFHSNDYIKGTYKDVNFESADVYISVMHYNREHNQEEVLFKGQWFVFDFPKAFKSNVIIYDKSYNYKKLVNNYDWGVKKNELEDINFNELFNVYAATETDCFYILTPPVIERIKNLNNMIKGRLMIGFYESKLHIGVDNGRDLFELEIDKNTNLEDIKKNTTEELNTIIQFIEELKLDNDIFK